VNVTIGVCIEVSTRAWHVVQATYICWHDMAAVSIQIARQGHTELVRVEPDHFIRRSDAVCQDVVSLHAGVLAGNVAVPLRQIGLF
jgi:hypothetical protein